MSSSNGVFIRHEELSSFPAWAGVQSVLSGPVRIDVRTGRVELPQGQNPSYLSRSLDAIGKGVDRFRSALIFADQPSSLKIDGRFAIPAFMGFQRIQADIKESLEINSFIRQAVSIMLSTSPEPPILALGQVFPFIRVAGFTAETSSTFSAPTLSPVDYEWSKGTIAGRPFLESQFSLGAPALGEEGPFTGGLGKKTFTVSNIGSNALMVKLQYQDLFSDTFLDMGVTGPNGIRVEAGEGAVIHVAGHYERIQVLKKSPDGSAVSGQIRLTAKWGTGGG